MALGDPGNTGSLSVVGLARATLRVMGRNQGPLEGVESHHHLPKTVGPSLNLYTKQDHVKGPETTV